MDKLIVLILSIVMVFGGWQVGGQPNETTAKELSSKMNVQSSIAKYSTGDPDVLNLSGLRSYLKQSVTVTVGATATDGTVVTAPEGAGTYTTEAQILAKPFTANSLFKIVTISKDSDGKITSVTVNRVKIN